MVDQPSGVNTVREMSVNRGDGGDRAIEREAEGVKRNGIPGIVRSTAKLYGYDRAQGARNSVPDFVVTKADRLAPDRVRDLGMELYKAYQIDKCVEDVLYDFDHALHICYAINGASQLLPSDRVLFYSRGDSYNYATAMGVLGVDARRFFRARADDIYRACKQLYEKCSFTDEEQVYARDLMIQLADDRDVSRSPWLIADGIEASVLLTPNERATVARSKASVIGSTVNSVDRRAVRGSVVSADDYDSSNFERVSTFKHEPVYTK